MCAARSSRGDLPLDDVKLEAAGARDVVRHRLVCAPVSVTVERSPRAGALPDRRSACRPRPRSPLARSRPSARVTVSVARCLRNEEAQAHRGGEEALLRGLALLVRLLREARRLRDQPRSRRPRRRPRSSPAACPTGSGSRSGTSSTAGPSQAAAPRRARDRPRPTRSSSSASTSRSRPRARCRRLR